MDNDIEQVSENFFINMLAGAFAGIMENTLFFPLDTAKTRIQDLTGSSEKAPKGVLSTLYYMIRKEGLLSPYKGFGITVLGSAPSHGFYFGTYEFVKSFLSSYSDNSVIYGMSGAMACLAHDSIMVPTETVKQRLQVENSPYKSLTDCIWKVYKTDGIKAFYRAFGTQIIMNIPFQSMQFTTYELVSNFLNPGRDFNLSVHLVSGAIAGATAAAVTTPLDVCKTMLNLQNHEKKIIGIKNALRTVYKLAGPFGFFRGITARILFIMPSTAVCWGAYETVKFLLKL